MLVLDLSKDHSKLGHMGTWCATRCGDHLGDETERGVLIVKIPGRRDTLSTATVVAKRKNAKHVTAPSNSAVQEQEQVKKNDIESYWRN